MAKKKKTKDRSIELAVKVIKKWEGFMPEPYLCPSGVPTIGYGNTMYPTGERVTIEDPKIDKKKGEEILSHFVLNVKKQVEGVLEQKLTDNQLAALISFTYNVGIGNLSRSTLLSWINVKPEWDLIPDEFRRWNKGGGKVLKGLVSRREDETALWEGTSEYI